MAMIEAAMTIGKTGIIPFLRKDSDEEKACRHIFNYLNCEEDENTSSTSPICDPTFMFQCPEYYRLQLPRQYQPGSSLSKHTVMLVFEWLLDNGRGTIVFALDMDQVALYHIFTKKEHKRYPFLARDAYAAVDDNFYFVGGCFANHDKERPYKIAFEKLIPATEYSLKAIYTMARNAGVAENKKNLEVETFNLRTGEWEDKTNCTKLEAPKHHPIVFTFNRKIYALAAKKPYWDLGDSFKSFEFLDTTTAIESRSGSPRTWKRLELPPFTAVNDTRHFLWKEKKCLFVKVSDDDANGRLELVWKFDLVSETWYNNTTDPSSLYYDPKDSEFLNSLTDVPARHFEGCIVHNTLFHFEDDRTNHEARLLVGHDFGGEKVIPRRWEIDLKNILQDEGHGSLSAHHLSHIEHFNFCLVINYMPSYDWNVNFLCVCKFKLLLKSEEAMPQNLYEFHSPTLIDRKHFQLPNFIVLTYHTKLENRDGTLRDDIHLRRDTNQESTSSVKGQTT